MLLCGGCSFVKGATAPTETSPLGTHSNPAGISVPTECGAAPIPSVTDVTYVELMRLRKTSSFIPNQWYRISDFRTRWQSHLTGTVHEGGIEPLLVQAVTR